MSSKSAAKPSTSDKVDVSFATDDEEETSSSSAADESENEITSSSESDGDQKSEDDGDADDEGEMPTFTLSLQTSAGTDDADDTLPDLSRPATKLPEETMVSKTSFLSKTETKTYSSVSQSVDSEITKTAADAMSDVTDEPTPASALSAKEKEQPKAEAQEQSEKESVEESEESEESEEEEEDASEEDGDEGKEQHLAVSSTTAKSSSTTVSNVEENNTSSSELSVTGLNLTAAAVEDAKTLAAAEQTKAATGAEKAGEKEPRAAQVESQEISVAKPEEKTSVKKEQAVVQKSTKVEIKEDTSTAKDVATKKVSESKVDKIITAENKVEVAKQKVESDETLPDLSRAAAAKVSKTETTYDVDEEVATILTIPNQQTAKKNKKESANKEEAKLESAKTGTTHKTSPSSHLPEVNDSTHEERVKEIPSSSVKSTDTDAGKTKKSSYVGKTIKLPKTQEPEETTEVEKRTQTETGESSNSSKSRKTKVDTKETKETKQEVTSSIEEEITTATVIVETKKTKDKSESGKGQATKSNVDDIKPTKSIVKAEKIADSDLASKIDKVSTTPTVAIGEMPQEVGKVATDSTETRALCSDEIAINGSIAITGEVEEKSVSMTPEIKLFSKKKSKHAESQGTDVMSVASATKVLQVDDEKAADTVQSNAVLKVNDTSTSSVAGLEKKSEKSIEEIPSKKDRVPSGSEDLKADDAKPNQNVDDGKLTVPDDSEFRPRRNSIDEFIKRILAEAREEQKKILDSCAVETTSETSASTTTTVVDGVPSPRVPELEPQPHKEPLVNGVDVGVSTKTSRRNRDDFDIDDELADISRYYAKRTLIDRVPADNEESEAGSTTLVDDQTTSKVILNGNDGPSTEEVIHFVPQRRESTAAMVRESSRPVRVLVDQQTSVIRQLTEASRAIDELDNEIRQLRQSSGGRDALYSSIGAAIRDELRLYELEVTAASDRLGQQRLPGGGRFIREQFVAQCAAELLQRTATNGPRLDRAAVVEDWTRVGRRRSGSFSAAATGDDDVGIGSRSGVIPWMHASSTDRDTSDLMIQYRHSRSGSVVSDRGYSSVDVPDEHRSTSSALLARLVNGSTIAGTEFDVGRYSRASSEAPRPGYPRSQPALVEDWLTTGTYTPSYTTGRHYSTYGQDAASTEDTGGDTEVGYRISTQRSKGQTSYRRYQPPSYDHSAAQSSRLHARRGSLQNYGSYDTGSGSDAGQSFNSRFLSRVREKKALGETTPRQASSDRPFRSRFLKTSTTTSGKPTTYSSYRSYSSQFDDDDDS